MTVATAPTAAEALVRLWYNSLDFSLLDEQILWRIATGFPVGGDWVGRGVVRDDFFPRLRATFELWKAAPAEFVAQAGKVVAIGEYEGRFRGRPETFRLGFVHVFEVKLDKIASVRQWTDTAELARFA